MKNILEKFELVEQRFPNKVLYSDIEKSITFTEFKTRCKQVASEIIKHGFFNRPIAVVDNRNVNTLIAMFGIVYSGNHYVVLDGSGPVERLVKICDVVEPSLILCEEKTAAIVREVIACLNVSEFPEIIDVETQTEIDEENLTLIREKAVATDLVYILFTSGSTGTPKGTVITHANVLSYMQWFIKTFGIDENTVFASQTPFYFSASVSDTYSAIFAGATLNIIPRSYFSFPIQLVRFMNERKVNTIYWVPSALCLCANLKLLDYEKPQYLQKVMFAGEIMPCKQLNYWRRHLPEVQYANLFGPTEIVDICTYYKVDRELKDDDSLPIGKHCEGLTTFILGEDGKEITERGKTGELYVRGPFVSYGYYKNEEATKKAFVQNPLHDFYPEKVYKTGDLVQINKFGEYEFVGRVDFQIKHKGYRIELGEIERVAGALDKVDTAVAVYDKQEDMIILVYTGRRKNEEVLAELRNKIPDYMVPERVIKVSQMPVNSNGKIDRKYLMNTYKTI